MKHFLIILLFLIASSSYRQKSKVTREKLDSLTKEKHNLINAFLELSSKDNTADIGTGTGYSLVPIANDYPECKFTIEDIDSLACNRKTLSKQIAKTGNKTELSNFSFCYGTEKSTNLPAATFNKVLIFDVIHEMTYKAEMLNDIKRILQKDGALFIEEILVHKKVKKDKVCNYPFLTEGEFKEILASGKLLILKEQITFDTGNNKYFKIFKCIPVL